MLKVTRDERSFIVESDDKNAENAALEAAIEEAAPHLIADFAATQVEDDGWLRWRVQREDWTSLLEAMDVIEGVNPEETEAIMLEVEAAIKEPV